MARIICPTSICRIVFLLVEIDRIGRAEFFASFAGSFLEEGAIFVVNHRELWELLGEGSIDCFAVTQTSFKNLIDDFLRAFFLADTTAGAQVCIDIARFLTNGDLEIAHITIHMGDFAQVSRVMLG